MATKRKPRLAVWKFASCDGCQLSLLDCEDELLGCGRPGRDRLFPGGLAGGHGRSVRRLAGGRIDYDAGRRRADPRGARRLPSS